MSHKINTEGLNLIKESEGLRLSAYYDSVGVLTIGYGTTNACKDIIGTIITPSMTITKGTAEKWLQQTVDAKYMPKVDKYDSKYHWTDNEASALCSFAYNIGSIDQLTANGTRTKSEIANKMLAYNKAGGKVLAGLTERRKKEQALFLKGSTATTESTSTSSSTSSSKHVPLNYKVGATYKVTCSTLNIRTKKASENVSKIPSGTVIGTKKKGASVKCQATTLVNNQIWMYIGVDSKNREQWLCADTGSKAYIE